MLSAGKMYFFGQFELVLPTFTTTTTMTTAVETLSLPPLVLDELPELPNELPKVFVFDRKKRIYKPKVRRGRPSIDSSQQEQDNLRLAQTPEPMRKAGFALRELINSQLDADELAENARLVVEQQGGSIESKPRSRPPQQPPPEAIASENNVASAIAETEAAPIVSTHDGLVVLAVEEPTSLPATSVEVAEAEKPKPQSPPKKGSKKKAPPAPMIIGRIIRENLQDGNEASMQIESLSLALAIKKKPVAAAAAEDAVKPPASARKKQAAASRDVAIAAPAAQATSPPKKRKQPQMALTDITPPPPPAHEGGEEKEQQQQQQPKAKKQKTTTAAAKKKKAKAAVAAADDPMLQPSLKQKKSPDAPKSKMSAENKKNIAFCRARTKLVHSYHTMEQSETNKDERKMQLAYHQMANVHTNKYALFVSDLAPNYSAIVCVPKLPHNGDEFIQASALAINSLSADLINAHQIHTKMMEQGFEALTANEKKILYVMMTTAEANSHLSNPLMDVTFEDAENPEFKVQRKPSTKRIVKDRQTLTVPYERRIANDLTSTNIKQLTQGAPTEESGVLAEHQPHQQQLAIEPSIATVTESAPTTAPAGSIVTDIGGEILNIVPASNDEIERILGGEFFATSSSRVPTTTATPIIDHSQVKWREYNTRMSAPPPPQQQQQVQHPRTSSLSLAPATVEISRHTISRTVASIKNAEGSVVQEYSTTRSYSEKLS